MGASGRKGRSSHLMGKSSISNVPLSPPGYVPDSILRCRKVADHSLPNQPSAAITNLSPQRGAWPWMKEPDDNPRLALGAKTNHLSFADELERVSSVLGEVEPGLMSEANPASIGDAEYPDL